MAEPASTLAAGPVGAAGTDGSVGTVETQYLDLPEPVRLDCGRDLYPVRVAYETYGALSPQRDNVILVSKIIPTLRQKPLEGASGRLHATQRTVRHAETDWSQTARATTSAEET